MSKIVFQDGVPKFELISPSWLEVRHREPVTAARACADRLFDRRCLTETSIGSEEQSEQELTPFSLTEVTRAYPMVWRDSAGAERCINDLSPWVASGSLYPDQAVVCFVFEESNLDPQRIKLIDFRYRVLDPSVMPLDSKSRKQRADRLIMTLNEDNDLARCIEYYWFGREPAGLSAADKSQLTNGLISKTKFQPSHNKPRQLPTSSQRETGSTFPEPRQAG